MTILVAVSGMSPAILTETVWAMAGETPPIVPDEVVVITTDKGRQDIDRDLLAVREDWGGRSVWQALRDAVAARSGSAADAESLLLSVRVIEVPDAASGVMRPANDIRTEAENAAAADFILKILSPYVMAEDCRVIASIAGGRKTMGALLYAAMSLIGRETDRITHVLVSEPFETCRGFFYPDQPVRKLEAGSIGRPPVAVDAREARVDLADLPFVPLRNGFAELNEAMLTFRGLVERYSRDLRRLPGGKPRVSLDLDQGLLRVEGKPVKLTGRCLFVAAFLFQRAVGGAPFFEGPSDERALVDYRDYFEKQRAVRWNSRPLAKYLGKLPRDVDKEDLTRGLSELRDKLKKAGATQCIPFLAPDHDRIGFDITPV